MIRRQATHPIVEVPLIEDVCAIASGERITIRSVYENRVRLRGGVNDLLRRSDDAVGANRIHRDLIARVRSTQQEPAGPVGGNVTSVIRERATADVLEMSAGRFNRETANGPGLIA